jgi:hypothetical protein
MPRKRFDDKPYNPIEADLARDAASIDQRRPASNEAPIVREGPAVIELENGYKRSQHSRSSGGRLVSHSSKSEVAKRFTVTVDEDQDLTAFLQRLQRQSGTRVALSLLIRAGLHLMMQAETDIVSQMRKSPPPRQPATHDSLSYAEFEQYWTQLIGEALRHTPPLG